MKKVALILSLIGIALSSPVAAREITLEEALAAVENHFSDKQVELRVIPDSMATDWQLFVDANPMAGWEHECYIAKVPKEGDAAVITDMQRRNYPPDVEMFSPYSSKTGMMKASSLDWKAPITVAKRNLTEQEQAAANRTFAIILNGGCNKNMNNSRYWNDCSFIYQVLRNHYGIPKENIYPLIADGNDPAEDMLIGKDTYASSPTDLDDDGVADIYGASSATSVHGAVNKIMEKARPGDQVFFYVTDHGGSDGNKVSYILMWNEEKLYDYELARTFAQLIDRGIYVNMVLGQCYSGGFIDNFEGKTCVIATACPWNRESWFLNHGLFDIFLYHWTCSVNMADEQGRPLNYNTNNDNVVTMEEAFFRTQSIHPNEYPQYYSYPIKLGKKLSFSYIPTESDIYRGPVMCMRDNYNDNGNGCSQGIFWDSPDLGIGTEQNGVITHSTFLGTNGKATVSVKVHNHGDRDYDGGAYMNLHWAKSSEKECADLWNGKVFDENGNALGGIIGGSMVPGGVAPSDSTVMTFTWKIPDIFKSNNPRIYPSMDVKILAYIFPNPNFNITDGYDVKLDSSIVIKKHSTQDWTHFGGRNVSISNPTDETKVYTLKFIEQNPNPQNGYYPIKIKLSDALLDAWKRTNYAGDNFTYDYNGTSNEVELTTVDSNIKLSLTPGQSGALEVFFGAKYLVTALPTTRCFDLEQLNEFNEAVNGHRFTIHSKNAGSGGTIIQIDAQKNYSDSYLLSPDISGSTARSLLWKDSQGEIISDASLLEVNPIFNNEIYIEAEFDDGETSVGCVKLPVSYGIEKAVKSSDGNSIETHLIEPMGKCVTLSISSVSHPETPFVTHIMEIGEKIADIDISELPTGVCNVAMVYDGYVLHNFKFVK